MLLFELHEYQAMHALFELSRANKRTLAYLEGGGSDNKLVQQIAWYTLEVTSYAQGISPWLTGTLSSAHRGHAEATGYGAHGWIDIDPFVINPVFGGHPAVYGEEVHLNQPWFDWTVEWAQEEVMVPMVNDISFWIDYIWGIA